MTRYSRQTCLREWGEPAQKRLKEARVLVVGAGGLGSPALYYLAAAGVGHLGLVDSDRVDLSNLQRQILFETSDVGRAKAVAAAERLSRLNPEIKISSQSLRVRDENVEELISEYDVVIDATDGFESRETIHDACFKARKVYIHGAVDRFEGRVGVFFHSDGPCYRCLFPSSSTAVQNCAEAGVLGVLPGVIGTLQATEALKVLTGVGQPLANRLMVYDALSMEFRTFEVSKNPNCPLCGVNPVVIRKKNSPDISLGISPDILRKKMAQSQAFRLIDLREASELLAGKIDSALHVPLSGLVGRQPSDIKSLQSFDMHLETVLYCQRGKRSAQALELFRKAGFQNVTHLEGGFEAYRECQASDQFSFQAGSPT
jgi:adenylyltransferase/sulfurtransferase